MKRTIIHFPDIVTLLNLSSGFLALYFASFGMFIHASIFILCGVFFDFMDGKFARWLKIESELGKNLDSLSDIVSFGIAPAFLLVMFFGGNMSVLIVSVLFLVAGAYRLARFNVIKQKGFIGMPITVNGIIIPILVIFGLKNLYVYMAILFIFAFLMISKIRFPKIG